VRIETQLIHYDSAPGDPFHPAATPIYQTATFRQPAIGVPGEYDYTRSGNPTRAVLEKQLARLEGGVRALAFNSGMAAIMAVTSLLENGEEMLAGDDLYGGTWRLLIRVLRRQGVSVRFVDTTDIKAVTVALRRRPRLLLLETPTNPLQKISDLAALAKLARKVGCLVAVDNSLMSPLLQRPLEAGVDLVIHSATKFLSGHSDVTGGIVVARDEELAGRIAFYQNAAGTALAPFDSWLLLRGMKTLGLRLERQQSNALQVADFLAQNAVVRRIHYAGLPGHPGRETHFRQASGAGSVISFETGSVDISRRVVGRLKLFPLTVSFGGVGSSISMPSGMSHASVPAEVRRQNRLPEDLIRVSIGIEHVEDLLQDLKQALAAGSARPLSAAGNYRQNQQQKSTRKIKPAGRAGRKDSKS
jgi:cysteine-S-conjugate beta-lyase